MKKIFILLLLLLNICIKSYAKDVKFIQVTDVHLTKDNAKYLQDFVDDLNSQQHNDLDFIVFTGDNIDKADKNDFDIFLSIISKLKTKTYITTGNHDLAKNKEMTSLYYMKRAKKVLGKYHPSTANYVFKKDNIVFIAMNGVKEVIPGPNGYYKEPELIWLDKQLTKYKNNKVVILQHFPLLDTKPKSATLHKKELYLDVLNKHDNVLAIVSGHYHCNREEKIGNVYNIITPKFNNNTCYKLITIDENENFVYTNLIDKNEKWDD